MNGQVGPNGQPAPTSVDENTDFSTMTDEELDAAFASTETPEAAPEQPAAPDATPAPTPEVGKTAEGTVIEPETPAEPPVETPKEAKVLQPEDQDYKKSFEALSQQHANLQQVYGRLTNEVGELRKRIPAKPTQEQFDSDTVAATEQLQAHNQGNQEVQAKELQAQQAAVLERNINFHKTYTPDLLANSEGIRALLVEQEGMDTTQVSNFMGNLFNQDPMGVYMLNKNYKASLENKALKAKLVALENVPNKAVETMVKVNKQTQSVTATTGESDNPVMGQVTDPLILANMSDADLDKQLFNSLKQEKLNG
jgi:hypothetical protein